MFGRKDAEIMAIKRCLFKLESGFVDLHLPLEIEEKQDLRDDLKRDRCTEPITL